jgi:acyl-CoA thioesterase-1
MSSIFDPIVEITRRSVAAAGRSAARRLVASWTLICLSLFVGAPAAVSQPAAASAASAASAGTGARPAPGGAAASTAPALVVLGDSLSAGYGIRVEEGWVALLQKRLRDQGYGYRVVNASVSGETTGGALARLPRVLQVQKPAIVIVELGGNDGLRGVPIPEMRSNLERIATLSHAAGAAVLIVGMRIPSNYGPQYTEQFATTFADVAKRHKAALVPFFLERIALNDALFQADGIHPVASAQKTLLDTVWPVLQPMLRKTAAATPR